MMPTQRSRNKLEFKAHMSIHNLVDVKEDETHASNFTRDRFGKSHRLQNEDGTSRIQRTRRKRTIPPLNKVLTWAILGSVVCGCAWAGESVSRRNTDIKAESGELKGLLLDQKLNPSGERDGLPKDESAVVEINDEGDPNLGMRF